MTCRYNERIMEYMKRTPDVRNRYVAGIFGVSVDHVAKLRRQIGAFDARKKAAIARNVRAADLDKQILAAVYKRGLVDTVLANGK